MVVIRKQYGKKSKRRKKERKGKRKFSIVNNLSG